MNYVAHNWAGKLSRLAVVLMMMVFSGVLAWARADDGEAAGAKFTPEAAATFNKRCTACHTYGKGVKVGPDLKGVNERRKRDWLIRFIHGSSAVIKSGDPIATSLFAQYKQQRMPDWTDLTDKQITDILDYIVVGGPDIKPPDERNAELATAAEVEIGRQLFFGRTRLKYGAQACSACHGVPGEGVGGTLGPNLAQTYIRYQDRALTEFLRHPCFRWETGGSSDHYLTARESFSLKAFLRSVALHQQQPAGSSRSSASAKVAAPDAPNQTAAARQQEGQKGSAR